MAEFTKGEWKVKRGQVDIYNIFVGKSVDDIWIAQCSGSNAEANACLIAAAPDLYAACEEIDHFFNESVGQVCTEKQAYDAYHNSGTSDKVKAALAKANREV